MISITIGTVEVRVAPVMLALIGFSAAMNKGLEAVAIAAALLIHESAHAAAANILGIQIESIELMPYGGVQRIAGYYQMSLLDEVILSLSGPLFNLFSAMLCGLMMNFGFSLNLFFDQFMRVSFGLCLFNILPALPLDGGRVVRALLSEYFPYKKASRIAGIAGMLLASSLFVYAVVLAAQNTFNILLLLTALFIGYGVFCELKNPAFKIMKDMSTKCKIITERMYLDSRFLVVSQGITLGKLLQVFSPGKYYYACVVDEHLEILGFLDEKQIVDGAAHYGLNKRAAFLLKCLDKNNQRYFGGPFYFEA